LGDMFNKATDIYPGKIGLVDDVGCWTYRERSLIVDNLAISFIKLGIKPKDGVFTQLPNWHEYIYSFFALQKIGGA
jgi:non-ribosomal peptide synthetase component E (peptide arylation enzyme)